MAEHERCLIPACTGTLRLYPEQSAHCTHTRVRQEPHASENLAPDVSHSSVPNQVRKTAGGFVFIEEAWRSARRIGGARCGLNHTSATCWAYLQQQHRQQQHTADAAAAAVPPPQALARCVTTTNKTGNGCHHQSTRDDEQTMDRCHSKKNNSTTMGGIVT